MATTVIVTGNDGFSKHFTINEITCHLDERYYREGIRQMFINHFWKVYNLTTVAVKFVGIDKE